MISAFRKDSQLIDLLKVYKNVIPKSLCDNIIDRSINFKWKRNGWLPYKHEQLGQPNKEFEPYRGIPDNYTEIELLPLINNAVDTYIREVTYPFHFLVQRVDPPVLLKYETGTELLPHHDHGDAMGIPILTVMGLLNDDFGGGELVFWHNETIKLEAGDIIIFPTLFAYTHQINKITHGTRYSMVSWIF
jgi:hypothetical protein